MFVLVVVDSLFAMQVTQADQGCGEKTSKLVAGGAQDEGAWKPHHGSLIMEALSWKPYHGSLTMEALSWKSHREASIMEALCKQASKQACKQAEKNDIC